MKNLLSESAIKALEQFQADDDSLPKQFRCNCVQKLLGGDVCRWIYRKESKIISAPAGRQSSNGLAEQNWKTVCAMARAYIT